MNVSVVGSYGETLSKRNKENSKQRTEVLKKFQKACSEIGKILADGGHRLIVAHGENPGSAEAIALDGFKTIQPYKFYRNSYS
jgi:carbamate kinase